MVLRSARYSSRRDCHWTCATLVAPGEWPVCLYSLINRADCSLSLSLLTRYKSWILLYCVLFRMYSIDNCDRRQLSAISSQPFAGDSRAVFCRLVARLAGYFERSWTSLECICERLLDFESTVKFARLIGRILAISSRPICRHGDSRTSLSQVGSEACGVF